MSHPTNEQLAARIVELEEQVRQMRELLNFFVSVDDDSGGVTLVPDAVRCSHVAVLQSWEEDGEIHELERIELCADEEQGTATVRLFAEYGELAYDIEACDAFVGTRHYQDGRLRLQSRAASAGAAVIAMNHDGALEAASLCVDHRAAGLRVYRPDGTLAAAMLGTQDGVASVSVRDTEGSYDLVRMDNGGDNLGSIDGFRGPNQLWLRLKEIDGGQGGRLDIWSDSHTDGADFSVIVMPQDCTVYLGKDGRDNAAIQIEANDQSRQVNLCNFLGDDAVWMSVDAGGNVSVGTAG